MSNKLVASELGAAEKTIKSIVAASCKKWEPARS
jgi:DNA-binding NarL/FixJ family response regulator